MILRLRSVIRSLFLVAFIVVLVGSFAHTGLAKTNGQEEKSASDSGKDFARQGLLADDWFQTSGEAQALYSQGYDSGTEELAADLAQGSYQNPAVVLDIDDTVLDDSPYQALLIDRGEQFPYKYDEWVDAAQAEALPGALDFLSYANQNGVDIYYVSGRTVSQLDPTVENLQNVGAPQATAQHVLLTKPDEEGKDSRFESIESTHEVLLYFGDNLGDFPGFGDKTLQERNQMTDQEKEQFGDKYIVFPNPMYGSWESALYGSADDPSEAEKTQLREQQLNSFDPQSAREKTTEAVNASQSKEATSMPDTGGYSPLGLVSVGFGAAMLLLGSGMLVLLRSHWRS